MAVELDAGDEVTIGVGELAGDAVGDAVALIVSVGTGVAVWDGRRVALAVADAVAVAEGVWLGARVAVGVLEGVDVDVGGGVCVKVAVGTGVAVSVRAVPVITTKTGEAVWTTVGNVNGDSGFGVDSGLATTGDATGDSSALEVGEETGLATGDASTVSSTATGLACTGIDVGEARIADGLDSTAGDAGWLGNGLASDAGVPTFSGVPGGVGEFNAIGVAPGVGVP